MNIGKDSVVSFHYRLCDSEGVELENSRSGDPMIYLHGHAGIVPGLESEMTGRAAGDTFTTTLQPEQGYGRRKDDATQRVQKKYVLTHGKISPGMVISVSTEHGPRQVTVIKAGKFVVDVDTNHPLAGAQLTFDVEIIEVREASEEERAHRHAHGPDGHHH